MTSTSSGRKKRPWWQWAIGAFVALIVLAAIFGEDEDGKERAAETGTPPSTSAAAEPDAAAETAVTGPTGPTETIQDARDLVDEDDFDGALLIAAALGGAAEERIRGRIADRIGRRVSAAVRSGRRGSARRLLASSSDYPSTRAVTNARAQLRSSEQRAAARRRERVAQRRRDRAAAAERRALAAQQRRAEREAAAEPEPSAPGESGPDTSGPSTTNYCGKRDGDGDGIFCE